MFYLTEEEFQKRMEKIQAQNKQKEYRRLLKEERRKSKMPIKLPSTSKLILLVGFLLCLEIIIFCQYAMITTMDLSALYAMIGIVATFSSMVLGYFLKSKSENTVGGITYDMAMLEASQNASYESTEGVE